MKGRLIGCVVVLGLLVAGASYFYWQHQKKSGATVMEETASQREESMRAAYSPDGVPDSKESHVKFENITKDRFARLAKAIKDKDREAMTSVISGKAMYEYAERAGLMDFVPSRERSNVIKGLQVGIANGLINASGLLSYDDVEVVRIEPIKENEFIVYTRMWDDRLEVYTKMRWWFLGVGTKRWVIYDYEDFDTNIRASTLMSAAMSNAMKGGKGWASDFLSLTRAFSGANVENLIERLQKGEEKAKALLKHKEAPEAVKGYARVMLVSSLIAQERFEDAMTEVKILIKEHPDIPMALYSKGSAHLGLEQWDQAVQDFTKYAELLGWDSDVHEMIADAYLGKKDFKQAQEHARKGLMDNQNSYGCLATYALSVPEDQKDSILSHIQKTKDPESAYEYVMDYAIEEENISLAKWLLEKLKVAFPKSELIAYYEEELADSNAVEAEKQEE